MIKSDSLKYVFVSSRKCATNTLYTILQDKFDGVRLGTFHENNWRYIPYGYYTVSACRNPYNHALSMWASTCLRDDPSDHYTIHGMMKDRGLDRKSFVDFLKLHIDVWESRRQLIDGKNMLISQYEWKALHRIKIDKYIRVGNLVEDIKSLPFYSGQDLTSIPKENSTDEFKDQKQLTPEAIELINHRFKRDFEVFGYEMKQPQNA